MWNEQTKLFRFHEIIREKRVSAYSLTTPTHNFPSLLLNIFAKTKTFAKPFKPVHVGVQNGSLLFKQKNWGRQSRDTILCRVISML